jgi:aspartyl-tRNA synthetase
LVQFPGRKLHQKETDAIEWVKRPQVGAGNGLCEMQRWNKSSVDKFYDQDDLSAWAKTTGAKAGDMILFYLALPKTRTQLSALRMELATRLGLRIPTEFAPLWVVDFHY